MRITIRTDIGGENGLGHGVRMLALAKALHARGASVRFLTGTPALHAFVSPFMCHEVCGMPIMTKRVCDVYVVDTKWRAMHGTSAYLGARRSGVRVVHIDSPHATPATCDLLIAPVAHWEEETVERLRADFGERLLYGWGYAMLDEAVTRQQPLPYTERDNTIVFCAGGSDPGGALAQMLGWTASMVLPGVRLLFCEGTHTTKLPVRWRGETTTHLCRYIVPFTRNKLREASLVVSMFGVTAYECMYYRTPCIVTTNNPQDASLYMALAQTIYRSSVNGLAPFTPLDALHKMSSGRFNCTIQMHWKNQYYRQGMHDTSAGLIDGQGIARVADAILGLEEA